jgi:hypothetical protein
LEESRAHEVVLFILVVLRADDVNCPHLSVLPSAAASLSTCYLIMVQWSGSALLVRESSCGPKTIGGDGVLAASCLGDEGVLLLIGRGAGAKHCGRG